MDSDLTLDFIIIIVLIIANGLFSMTELAIVNAKKRKLEEMAEAGNERAKKAFELAENPNEMFSTNWYYPCWYLNWFVFWCYLLWSVRGYLSGKHSKHRALCCIY